MEYFDAEERTFISQTAEKFAKKEVLNRLKDGLLNGQEGFPREAVKKGALSGHLSSRIPEDLGGSQLDLMDQIIIFERLAEGAAGLAAIFAVHSAALIPLIHSITRGESRKTVKPEGLSYDHATQPRTLPGKCGVSPDNTKIKEYITRITSYSGDSNPPLLGLAFPSIVTDANKEGTRMVKEADGIRLSGEYVNILTPEVAGHTTLLVNDADDFFIAFIDSERLGDVIKDTFPGSGLDEVPRARLAFNDFLVKSDEIILEGDEAKKVMAGTVGFLKTALTAILIGNAGGAVKEALEYAQERVQTGRPIVGHQEVKRMLVGMEAAMEAGRSFIYRVASQKNIENPEESLHEMAYLFCGDAAEKVCLDAVQVLGGYGYMRDYGTEKRLRDTKTLQTLLGSYPHDRLGVR